jgi:WD40 repeat protein
MSISMRKNIVFYFVIIIYSVTSSAQNSKCIKTLIGHTDDVTSVCFSPDGKHLATGSKDKSIRIWDVASGKCIDTLNGHSSGVLSVCFSPDGKFLASGGRDGFIKIWDIEGAQCVKSLNRQSSFVSSVCFSPDGKQLASCGAKSIKLWDIENGQCVMTLLGHTKWVGSVCFSPGGKQIASGSDDETIRIWDIETGQCDKTLLFLNSSWVSSLCFSPDGKHLSSGGGDTTIKIWDVESEQFFRNLSGHTDWVNSVCFSPDGRYLTSGGRDRTIKIWDVESGKCIKTLLGHSNWVNSVCFSSDGTHFASGSDDKRIKIWEFKGYKPKPKLPSQLEASQLIFNDSKGNNNKIIDGNEQALISFQLKNIGKGSAYGIVVSLSTEQDVKGISYQKEYKIDELAPNEEKQIVLPIKSDFNTENAKVKFIIKTKEANGFDAPDEIIHVETAKFLNPLVSVADYNFSSEKGGIAKLGEVIKLNFAVQNKGQGEAKNVKIVCTLPSSNVFAAGETEFTVPLLKPNESKVINFDFFPNRIYKQSNIPVAIDITESYGKYGESKTCTVALNTELKQQNEIIVQGTKQESIEIKSVSLLSDIDKNLPITNGNNSNAIAVIIGNSNYANTKSIAYAISDAQSMKNYLINVLGFKEGNILFKENATLGDFNTLFGTKENQKGRLANTIKENISDVFVFYAGHGAPGLKDNKGYFVPVECNPNYVENSGYSLDVFYQNLGQLKAKSLTIVLDACFSGANVFDKISPLTIKVIDPVLTMKNAVVIASSTGTEVSTWYDEKQHGMFTYFFLKAIQDKEHSDKNHDGTLTYQELYEYVSDRNEGVPYQAARIHGIEQHPTITGDMKEKAFIKY